MRYRRGALLVALMTLAMACGDEEADPLAPGPNTPLVPAAACGGDADDERCAVFDLVNQERAAAGLAPYDWDPALAAAAQLHAEDMVAQDYFSHDSLDGRSMADRARDAGYDASPRGENIAAGQPDAASVMSSWMGSDGHRGNILSDGSNEIGVGLHERHWVQVFGRR